MTEVAIPVTTAWDVIANALDDPWFWIVSAIGAFGTAMVIRHRLGRFYRCSLP